MIIKYDVYFTYIFTKIYLPKISLFLAKKNINQSLIFIITFSYNFLDFRKSQSVFTEILICTLACFRFTQYFQVFSFYFIFFLIWRRYSICFKLIRLIIFSEWKCELYTCLNYRNFLSPNNTKKLSVVKWYTLSKLSLNSR